ncbi:MAG: GalNAc(5)-diNAcBac-PP-undecaprenol beta-1,3-glucosyltransferase [Planctomycetes bacterium ADurb.Bin401]|nr:MAG: GalNAc(5)-diNAcBac-PP-undecaprenol beta-1,3-glucosyltransferase [Planctomycetes bacterium ADurb.Bin401]
MKKNVSIIVPTHNRPQTLARALDSISRQTYKSIEVIVVNDGGCDVQDIINAFSEKIEIKYFIHQTSKGPGAARNTAIENAGGKYITYLDDDDIIYPEHIQTLADFLEASEYKAAYTDAYRILQEERNGKYEIIAKEIFHSQDFNRDYFLVASYIAVQSIMHQKACFEKSGYFDASLTTHEDLDLWIRLSHWYDFAHIKKVTSEFHEKNDGVSQTGSDKQRRLDNLELIYKRYSRWASPKIQFLQSRVLQRMYGNYGIEMPKRLKENS